MFRRLMFDECVVENGWETINAILCGEIKKVFILMINLSKLDEQAVCTVFNNLVKCTGDALLGLSYGWKCGFVLCRGFTKFARVDYVKWKEENRLVHDGVTAKVINTFIFCVVLRPLVLFLDLSTLPLAYCYCSSCFAMWFILYQVFW